MRPTIALSVFVAVTSLQACGTNVPTAPYPAEPPQVYVAKVKNILVGLPPTDDEISQVTKDPSSFGSLVDGWMQTPQYTQKMQVFFELAFQQTQISEADFVDLIPPNGIGTGRAVPLLVQNATESFARTVLQLNASGQPLTDAFTTHQLMMTTAMMELYGFLDARTVDDNGNITDSFQNANPTLKITMQTAGGMVTLNQAFSAGSDYMTFYVPDLPNLMGFPDATCIGEDPIYMPASAMDLHEILYGEIPTHENSTGKNDCGNRTSTVALGQMQASDFTDWRMVTITTPTAGQATTAFYNIPALRSSNTLVLNSPRVGFFTTPAFFANWPTNTSNQMRVTTNQALIVATGAQVDGTDSTVPPSTPGLDAQHAAPGTACYGCHQLLDPTRSVMSSAMSYYYYPQTDAALIAQPGLFAFEGVIAQQHTLDDFGEILSKHPLVPGAWAQKLCYYTNSAPCDPTDPAFQQIVASFSNGFAWNTLVHNMMVSPITTNAAESKTVDENGEVIAVARRDHLCAALNNRLGFTDICGLDQTLYSTRQLTPPEVAIQQIVSGLPSDGYGRGSTIPVLPNQPTLFYRAGLENVCEAVAQLTVDAPPNPNQPNAVRWSSTQANAAIADFVSTIMGLTTNDPRTAQATALLQTHFAQAQQTGADATSSLQSTFITACLSPTFIGIGM